MTLIGAPRRACLTRVLAGAVAASAVLLGFASAGEAAASLPGSPPVSQSSFVLEPAGSAPVDNDQKIPSPSTPPAPACTPPVVTAPSSGSVTALQQRIDADIAAGTGFGGDTICIKGVFRAPIHVRQKISSHLLTIARGGWGPNSNAIFDLAGVAPNLSQDGDPNAHDDGDLGAIEVGDSRDVEIYGLTVENWATSNINLAPAGLYVTTTRTDSADGVTESACYLQSTDGACGDIFLYDNTVAAIQTTAPGCGNLGNGNYGNAFGIAVKSFGNNTAQALQHVVIEGNTVTRTLTGQSETVTINGDVTDFLVAHNTISDVNNIGLDAIGWETGGAALPGAHSASQARNGLIYDNAIANVDTRLNPGYGIRSGSTCKPGDMDAGGIYVDGGSHLWINGNTVTNTNHGIELGAEDQDGRAGESADQLLVTANKVADTPGDGFGQPSKPYDDAGHAYAAFVVGGVPDGAGSSSVHDVYAHGNTFINESQFFIDPSSPPPPDPAAAVLFEGGWGRVWMLANTIAANGSADTLNPLLEVDQVAGLAPTTAPGVVVDCNRYERLSTVVNNFLSPNNGWTPFGGAGGYQLSNRFATSERGVTPARWDSDSSSTGTPPCPFAVPASG